MADSPSSDDSKRPGPKSREAEYQALWQVCDRTARKNEYKYADYTTRRAILEDACHALMNRRRDGGKVLCNTSIPEMVERHLKREAHSRIIHEARVTGQLPDSPVQVARTVRSATPQGTMADPQPMGSRIALPFGNSQPYAANIDPNPLTLRNEIVALRQEVARQHEEQQAIVSTLRGLAARLTAVENELAELRGGQGHGRLSFNEMDVHLRQTDLASHPRSVLMGENGLHHVSDHEQRGAAATQMTEGDIHFRPNYTYESEARYRAPGLFPHGTYSGPLYPDEGVEGPGFGLGFGSRPRERRPVTPRSQTHGQEDLGRQNI
ncbi:hypothetical protein FSOLCH5_004814 [Fusarium solani]|uniref:Uncharacterized protein n=1 Tax=Fusarium solani TaxID=169388 RepID=A0A9P9GD73_FUSSL|nr:uncharacterized protein B0J15DRAFT_570289 [Fusarium solani]KAH7237379.1 hypothetical protein B0J15DRAFT_570289 [Fusarium solani]KAJ3466717.1 hypothetical protein MRS44_004281 [Fusarium solani]